MKQYRLQSPMKLWIALLAVILLAQITTSQTSLCITCVRTISSICVQCSPTGCAPYSSFDSASTQCFCKTGYYLNNADSSKLYCDRCFIGCATCSGPLITNCLTCAANFTLDSSLGTCTAPTTTSDLTILRAYYFYGFNALGGWSPTTITTCGFTTLLGTTTSTTPITFSTGTLKSHFQIRLMFAMYLDSSSVNTNIIIKYDSVTVKTIAVAETLTSSNPAFSCPGAKNFVQVYVDSSSSHTATAGASISISTSTAGLGFAIRQLYVITKLCNGVCSSCYGYYANNCTTCADGTRLANQTTSTTNYVGTCVCVDLYYEEPNANTCVLICPTYPVQTFGDNATRKCLPNCPNNSYAYTDTYICVSDCPTTSIISGTLLFKDQLNWKCVPNCPSEAPYATKNTTFRQCFAICPNKTNTANLFIDFYAVNGLFPQCVEICPYNTSFWLFGYQGNCVPRCPSGTWGDPFSKLCETNCTRTSFLYKDSSTGLNICVFNCSSVNYYRDNTTFTCVLTCPNGTYGQTTRQCVIRCADGSFGLPFGNRRCVSFCPQGWWGEPDSNVCVNTTFQCKTTTINTTNGYYRYADNYTRTCVYPYKCSFGYYADNFTQSCRPGCPNAPSPAYVNTSSVGYINMVCQVTCQPPYFADYAAGMCVTTCQTNNTYADESTGRTCVIACNSAGLTPWANSYTRTCVSTCNSTDVPNFVSDNDTFSCVFNCPPDRYADRIATNNPTCRTKCLNGTYADNSTGTGICSFGCPSEPPRFGDPTNNLCVLVCTAPLFGDQTGLRLCIGQCPSGFYSQNDTTRQCVNRCKPGSYGSAFKCLTDPKDCPANQFANDATNLCDYCDASLGTWGDPVTKRCVTICPLNPSYSAVDTSLQPITYYADSTVQQCVKVCSDTAVSGSLTGTFGNNNTRYCIFKCQDLNSFAKLPAVTGGYRVCVARCYPSTLYANNQTRLCDTSINCPTNQFGDNITQACVTSCPNTSWAYATTNDKICIDICPTTWYGDSSTGFNVCIQKCPSIPSLFADPTTKTCQASCPIFGGVTFYADMTTRTCVTACPVNWYKYTPNRTCLAICPLGYFGKNVSTNVGECVTPSSQCGSGLVGDPFLNLCVSLCTGPTPVSFFAFGFDCISVCPNTYYSNTYNGVRECIQLCPPGSIDTVAAPNLYGDNNTKSCVSRCVQPLTWADPHTRLCQSVCSSTANPPLYSQNFGYTCVSSLNCPTSPSMTYGDNNTRSCVTNCSLGKFGDPVSRNCVTQCPNATVKYWSDKSTGQYICVPVCPVLPRLFGQNDTNTCVDQCAPPLYGDQTGERSCIPICPIVSGIVYFAQNISRICVTVCISGTWGYSTYRTCVESPFDCNAQWADSSTNLCVDVCPTSVGTFGDQTTKLCVALCPNTTALYFSDQTTRLCVQMCPASAFDLGTFGNNETRVCESSCSALKNGTILTYADPQTINRYCVLRCSQTPFEAFANPSTRTCVPVCPTIPDLYGQTTTFRCVPTCTGSTYADTNTRRCVSSCPGSQFKLNSPVNVCVDTCPPDQAQPLFGDPSTGFCSPTCTNNTFKYTTLSKCVPSCLSFSLFAYDMTCTQLCPQGFYANTSGVCVSPCPGSTFGQNTTTTCESTCNTGFAYNNLCIAVCPTGYYGENKVCVTACTGGNFASNVSNTCISNCTNGTYAQSNGCFANCTSGTYADPITNICSGSCSDATYYADPTTNKCVKQCPTGFYTNNGFCSATCSGIYYADNITWSCTTQCSLGYWGNNNLCTLICPQNFYAYNVDRICYSTSTLSSSLTLFADNQTQTWVSICPLTPLAFGDTGLRMCIPACLGMTLADPVSRKCENSCQNSSYFADFTTNACVLVCPDGFFANSNTRKCEDICADGYAYLYERTCVGTCPAPFSGYNNGTARICVGRCPQNYYSQSRVCTSTCTAPYYADNNTNQCVLSCISSYASSNQVCVTSCAPFPTYNLADNSSNQCVSICPSEPDYYSFNFICVKYCPNGTFADPTSGLRICTTLCTSGLYSNPISGRCQAVCPLGYWGQGGSINKCESVCSIGFADNSTGLCQPGCPSPTYADPTTLRCVKICPAKYWGEVNNTCVQNCTLPNYANPLTRRCESSCPSFDYMFAENSTASCVKNCTVVPNSYADRNINICVQNCTLPNEYMLDIVGICTSLCPDGQFMQNSTKRCQATCTTGFAEPTTKYCVNRCFGNPQTYGYQGVCHYRCLNSTVTLFADNSTNLCVSPCPSGMNYFSDPLSGNCVLWCPEGYFSQTALRTCTTYCVTGFADNLTRSCIGECPTDTEQTYGDPSTHRCVRICPDGSYAQNTTKQCVNYNNCPNNTWSDVISKFCVSRCPSSPLYFGLNSTTSCVPRCPSDLFGDYQSQTCISYCPSLNGQYRFADPVSQTCVFVCPIGSSLYGDIANFSCVDTCSNNSLRDNSTQRCVPVCPSSPSYWADTQSGNCVYHCPTNRFASNKTDRLCVSYCGDYLTFGDKLSQICVERCPENYWADNSSYLCVAKCPDSPDMYGDNVTKSCVYHCPRNGSYWITFADKDSRRCLTQCPDGFFGVNSTQRCQPGCPPNEYADPIIRVCVADCTVRPHYYKTSDGKCLFECPTIPVLAYMLNTNHSCVYTTIVSSVVVNTGCPSSHWADPITFTCTTLCPEGNFADQVKHLCVDRCPLGTFADQTDRLCKSQCSLVPEQYRLDLNPGTCVQFCPDPYFADNSTFYCVKVCPNSTQPMYSYLYTRTCVFTCPPPYYSYLPENTCRPDCPSGYFAQDSTSSCEKTCLPPFFADDSTNRCVLMCPDSPNYYGYQQVCGRTCTAPTFADNSTRMCVTQCPTQPQLFADNSTNKCVYNCPSSPNLYADNTTMVCVYYCPNGTFAQVTTRTCVPQCPPDLQTYADPTTGICLPSCPINYFASDLTKQCVPLCPNTPIKTYANYAIVNSTTIGFCVTKCPSNKFAENITRTCADDCDLDGSNLQSNPSAFADRINNVCVSTCPYGYFGDNSTFQCVKVCPDNSFADNTTRRCVLACPGTEKLYADGSTWRCVSSCPSGSFGNSQNWTCIPNCPPQVFGYKLDLSNLCVEECPSPYFAFQSSRTCLTNCGAGLYGDSATRVCKPCPSDCPTCQSFTNCLSCKTNLYLAFGTCVLDCPKGVYANLNSMSCVYAISCPGGTFGNNVTHSCSSSCPPKQYANSATRVCENCPETCETCTNTSVCLTCVSAAVFSQVTTQCYWKCSPTDIYNYNNTCKSACPDGSYLDYTNVNCQACNAVCKTCSFSATNCTSCSTGFLLNQTCANQCPSNFYGENNICLPCTPSVQACAAPLTFNVSSTTQNYQTVVYLKFNQLAIVKGDPKDFLSLNIKPNRLLQQTSINNGVPFTATVMPDGTIRLVVDSSITLTNPSFSIKINDASMISSASGASIQSLQADISNVVLNNYPAGTTSDAPLVVAGTALSILMLLLLAAIVLCTPLPAYLTLEAFQMIAFYALVVQLPPNLFYFMKKLSITRLSFLPNVFQGVYKAPSGFSEDIPTRMVDIDSLFGFSVTSGSYFFVLLLFAGIAGILFLASSKYNSNRPLRQLIDKIFNIRSKWGMVNDFLWMFSLNVFICGFMQFKYAENGSEIALAAISIIIFLAIIIGMFVHHCIKFDSDDEQSVQNYKFWHQGLKQGKIYQYTIFAYYIRKLLFAIVMAATINSTARTQCISLIIISTIMLVLLIIIRPYQDKLRNLIHILNQVGLTFIGGAMLYYQHYVEIMEPVGTKIICGTIITSVIIAHLSIALVWGLFKSYHFYKDLYAEFQKTEFYQLYLDQKYDESLEKELQDLNDETGQVQSVQLTKVADHDIPEEENIIKLKIKRRRKINKKGEQIESKPKIQREARDHGEYIRLEQSLEDQILPKKPSYNDKQFQRMVIEEQNPPVVIKQKQKQKKKQEPWQLILNGQFQRPQSRQNVFQPINDNDIISQNNDYEAMMSAGDIILHTEQNQTHSRKIEASPEFEEISSVSNKEERVSKEEGDQHLRESLRQINNDSRISDPFREEIADQELPNVISPSQIKQQPQNLPDELELVSSRPSEISRVIQNSINNANWQQLQSDVGEKKQQQNLFQRVSVASHKPDQVVSKKQHWDIDIDQMLQQQEKKPEENKKHMLLFDPQDFQ